MPKILHTARTFQIKHSPLELSGIAAHDALACIFEMFGIKINKDNIFVDEYKVKRTQLRELYRHISEMDADTKYAGELETLFSQAGIDKKKFLKLLDKLINKSDKRNSYVLLSWLDEEKKCLDLEDIKNTYFHSEVCIGEMLAFVPADGLTLEQAFNLYIEAMQWCEGDRFFRQTIEDSKLEELCSE